MTGKGSRNCACHEKIKVHVNIDFPSADECVVNAREERKVINRYLDGVAVWKPEWEEESESKIEIAPSGCCACLKEALFQVVPRMR